eukprot:gene7001-7745_t
MSSSSSLSVEDLITRNEDYFLSQSQDQLIDSLMVLINHIKDHLDSNSSSANVVVNVTGKKRPVSEVQSSTPPAPVDVSGTVEKLRTIIQKQIKSQLKWKASCKVGKAQGLCGSEEIFRALMKSKPLIADNFIDLVNSGLHFHSVIPNFFMNQSSSSTASSCCSLC